VLQYEGNVEDDLCLTFQVSIGQGNQTFTDDLKPGGGDMPVTNENREEYVALYTEWVINKSIYMVFRAFYHGFHSVCASNALLVSRAWYIAD